MTAGEVLATAPALVARDQHPACHQADNRTGQEGRRRNRH
jgi:hypothetical protein